MEDIITKTCGCCLAQGKFKFMWKQYNRTKIPEVYGEIMNDCFGIKPIHDSETNIGNRICADCINQLRDAYAFKKKVIESQKKLLSSPKDQKTTTQYKGIEYLEEEFVDSGVNTKEIAKESSYPYDFINDDIGNVIKEEVLDEDDVKRETEPFEEEYLEYETLVDENDRVVSSEPIMDEEYLNETEYVLEINNENQLEIELPENVKDSQSENVEQYTTEQLLDLLDGAENSKALIEVLEEECFEDTLLTTETTEEIQEQSADDSYKTELQELLENPNNTGEDSDDEFIMPKKKRRVRRTAEEIAKEKREKPIQLRKIRYTEEQLQECIGAVKSGHLNLVQAALAYDIPRQTVQLRMKKELGESYREVTSQWKKHQVLRGKKVKVNRPTRRHPFELQERAKNCVELYKTGTVSIVEAIKQCDINLQIFYRTFKQEYKQNYKEVLWNIKQKYYKYKRDQRQISVMIDGKKERTSRRRPVPSRDTLKLAVETIKSKKLSVYKTACFYDIPFRKLESIVRDNVDVDTLDIKQYFKWQLRKEYTWNDVQNCLNAVRKCEMTQKEACWKYKVPENIVYMCLRKECDEEGRDISHLLDTKNIETEENGQISESTLAKNIETEEKDQISEITNDDAVKKKEYLPFEELTEVPNEETEFVEENLAEDCKDNLNIVSPSISRELQWRLDHAVRYIVTATNATPFQIVDEKYTCIYCVVVFKDPDDLRLHTQTEHISEGDIGFEARIRSEDSKEIIRLDILDLQCNLCLEYIDDWSNIFDHLKLHKVNIAEREQKKIIPYKLYKDMYHCALCNESQHNLKLLDLHMNIHYANYVCHECGDTFSALCYLKQHKYLKGRKRAGKYVCEICDGNVEFDGQELLQTHLEKKHGYNRLVNCHYCSKTLKTQYERHVHMLERHRENLLAITCDLCNKVFYWKQLYMSHYKRMHVKKKSFKCNDCDQVFYSYESLIVHIRSHTGEKKKNYVCPFCKKRFDKLYVLKQHVMEFHRYNE